jgi:oxygen-independent coproporphyrinogen-3 oxidase
MTIPIKKELDLSARRGFITNLEGSRRGFITNYPNVTQWSPLTDKGIFLEKPLNIYVHIPFCAQQCSYCYYRVITGARKAEMDRYTQAVCQELTRAAEHYRLSQRPVKSIYFGGGTPTLLQKTHLAQISQTIKDNFNVCEDVEFTIEGEPVTMTEKTAEGLADLPLKVTRISMGVQSLDDEVVRNNQRKDTAEKVIKAIKVAQSVGAIVNIDLMSGLAGDSFSTWKNSVHKALDTGVESITVYKTEVFANTQYYKDLRKDAIHLPDDAEEFRYMEYALDAFEKANYLPWSFFTFTKNGDYPHIHTPRQWTGEDYLSAGTSAFGRLGNQLFQNSNDPEKYMQAIESGNFAITRGHTLTAKDEMVRTILLGMKLMKLDLDLYEKTFGFRLETLCKNVINELIENDFITLSKPIIPNGKPSAIVMTRKGLLHGDYIGKQLGRAIQNLDA